MTAFLGAIFLTLCALWINHDWRRREQIEIALLQVRDGLEVRTSDFQNRHFAGSRSKRTSKNGGEIN